MNHSEGRHGIDVQHAFPIADVCINDAVFPECTTSVVDKKINVLETAKASQLVVEAIVTDIASNTGHRNVGQPTFALVLELNQPLAAPCDENEVATLVGERARCSPTYS